MRTPNYHDFYQEGLIPIGYNDLSLLSDTGWFQQNSPCTHWLIAVEGEQLSQTKIYFHWKVSVYPSDSEGDFNWRKPFYCSPAMESMDQAISLAGTFVASGKNDELFALNLQEKIS